MKNYRTFAESFRDSDKKPHIYIACTGAGAGLQYQLWQVPGASSFLIGSNFPYAIHETDEFIGFKPEGYCTEETAMEMAMASYIRACEYEILNKDFGFPIGVGLTASVASIKKHRGDHRVFIAFMTPDGMFCYNDILEKDVGNKARREDDYHCIDKVISILYSILKEQTDSYVGLFDKTKEAEELLFKRPVFNTNGLRQCEPEGLATFLPGAFNPIHDGHRGMYRLVSNQYAFYAVTISSIHKPNLDLGTALKRAAMLKLEKWRHILRPFIFTRNDPLFIDKARQFPGSNFIIGADAAIRMLDPKWGVNTESLINEFEELNIKFCVFPRLIDGKSVSAYDIINMNNDYFKAKDLFLDFEGQWDISSTEIRKSK